MDDDDADFFFTPRIPLPGGHTSEILAAFAIQGGFVTKDLLGIARVWDSDGFLRGTFPPVAATDTIVFPSIDGKHVFVASITGELQAYLCTITTEDPEVYPPPAAFQLLYAGMFRDDPHMSWVEVLTCGYAAEDAQDVYVGTSGGMVYKCTLDPESGLYVPLPESLRRNDGFSCRGFMHNGDGNLYAVLQNGVVELLDNKTARHQNTLGGYLGITRISAQNDQFAAIRLDQGHLVAYGENDTVIIGNAEGEILHELHVSFVGSLAFAGDKLVIGSDEEGLLEFDFQTQQLAPLFEDEPWPEEFTITCLAILQDQKRILVAGIDSSINNVVLQVWDWDGVKLGDESRTLETLAVMSAYGSENNEYVIGTTSGGIWRGNAAELGLPEFFSVPKSVETVQILPVNDTSVLVLGNLNHMEIDLEENSGCVWLVDLPSQEISEELEIYEPIVGGFYDVESKTASIFSRGEVYEVDVPSLEARPFNQAIEIDDNDIVASTVTRALKSEVFYVGSEHGEVWEFPLGEPSRKIVDRDHGMGPIEVLALGPRDAPLLIAGFYRIIGIYWPQNGGFTKIFGMHSAMNCIAPHPTLPLFAAGALDCQVYLFDYNGNKLATLPPRYGKTIGLFWQTPAEIVVGYASGEVGVWDLSALDILQKNA